jgi:acyl-CoA reductase-like NAD-dependent aldehyde dehydrogenase
VGKQIVVASAGNLKRLSLELGGKAPSIVLPDADIDVAVTGNVAGALFNSGQVCAAYTRFFVHSSRAIRKARTVRHEDVKLTVA